MSTRTWDSDLGIACIEVCPPATKAPKPLLHFPAAEIANVCARRVPRSVVIRYARYGRDLGYVWLISGRRPPARVVTDPGGSPVEESPPDRRASKCQREGGSPWERRAWRWPSSSRGRFRRRPQSSRS